MKVDYQNYLRSDGTMDFERLERNMAMQAWEDAKEKMEKRKNLVLMAWQTVLWVSINSLLYFLAAFAYTVGPTPVPFTFYLPHWLAFQVLVNIVIFAVIQVNKLS